MLTPTTLTIVILASVWLLGPAHAEDPRSIIPDYELEGQGCGRIDLRPWLEKTGLPILRHQGGRLDAASFLVSEAAALVLRKPVSARSLEHLFDQSQNVHGSPRALAIELQAPVPSSQFFKTLTKPVCIESDVPSEDIESSRHARLRYLVQALTSQNLEIAGASGLARFASLLTSEALQRATDSPRICRGPRLRLPRFRRTSDANLGDRPSRMATEIASSFRKFQMPIVILKADFTGRELSLIQGLVARRLSVETGRCEYLLRSYEGSSCAKADERVCEDGSYWVSRDDLLQATQAVWSVR